MASLSRYLYNDDDDDDDDNDEEDDDDDHSDRMSSSVKFCSEIYWLCDAGWW